VLPHALQISTQFFFSKLSSQFLKGKARSTSRTCAGQASLCHVEQHVNTTVLSLGSSVNGMRLIAIYLLGCWLNSASASFHEAELIPTSRRAQFHGVRSLELDRCTAACVAARLISSAVRAGADELARPARPQLPALWRGRTGARSAPQRSAKVPAFTPPPGMLN